MNLRNLKVDSRKIVEKRKWHGEADESVYRVSFLERESRETEREEDDNNGDGRLY